MLEERVSAFNHSPFILSSDSRLLVSLSPDRPRESPEATACSVGIFAAPGVGIGYTRQVSREHARVVGVIQSKHSIFVEIWIFWIAKHWQAEETPTHSAILLYSEHDAQGLIPLLVHKTR